MAGERQEFFASYGIPNIDAISKGKVRTGFLPFMLIMFFADKYQFQMNVQAQSFQTYHKATTVP